MSAAFTRCCAEPFRICFPLGLVSSVIGVSLWPLFFHGIYPEWPLEAHARWMVPAFVGWLITGFLGTSGPRLLGTPSWSRGEFGAILLLGLSAMVALLLRNIEAADLCFALWFFAIVATLGRRVLILRNDIPPPGLPAALVGIAAAGIAALALAGTRWLNPSLPVWTFLRLLYFQGLIWLPVIAVAPYLLPRFFGKPSPHAFPESLTPPAGWWRAFAISSLTAVLILASFAIEAAGATRAGLILRAAATGGYLLTCVPGLASFARTNGAGIALRCVVPCAVAGWGLAAVWPDNGMRLRGMLHLMFIGGAGLLMFTVMTRVTLGHADRHDRLASPMKWFHAITGLLLFAAATRLTSDFIMKVRITHFTYAATLWVGMVIFHQWKIRRELRSPTFEPGVVPSRCPRRSKG
jgi:uncharacterized protein involved in response to NO